MREVIIGFDSAWADTPGKPGAIACYIMEGGLISTVHLPRSATFAEASQLIRDWAEGAAYVLIAIDQPTIVPNYHGGRPVDRVAGSLVSKLLGGVQMARRGGRSTLMFGDYAPIWRFLDEVSAIQNPIEAREAAKGRFLIEVFPALAIPAMLPEVWERRRGAKYNPTKGNFEQRDWAMVAAGIATIADHVGARELADWLEALASLEAPRKNEQDQLDAAICLTIAWSWRHGPLDTLLQIGDERTGYMATVVSPDTRSVLVKAALKRDVALDRRWDRGINNMPG